MHVSVRLSAALAQITGSPRLQVEVGGDATVDDLVHALNSRYPALAPRLKHAVPIVGGNHASPSDALDSSQEVAFLMPVAGGAVRSFDDPCFSFSFSQGGTQDVCPNRSRCQDIGKSPWPSRRP